LNCRLLYLAIGSRDLAAQALYACYSALAYRPADNVDMHVFTDCPSAFDPLREYLQVQEVSGATLARWQGQQRYPYRMKVAALEDMAERFPADKLLFADSDTFFTADFAPICDHIGPVDSVLQAREYPVRTHATGQLLRFRKQMGKRLFRGSAIDLDADMWNSGAIGLHPRNFHLLRTVLAFIDSVSPHYRKQLLEQYAVSYYLQKNTTVHPCGDVLVHYWQQKSQYQQAMQPMLARWKDMKLDAALQELRGNRITLPPFVRRHGWVRRTRDRFLGPALARVCGRDS
jgi:hypothetical protein